MNCSQRNNVGDILETFLKKYYYVVLYKILYKIFCVFPVKKNKVLLESFYGKGFSCNPKYIYLELRNNKDLDIVWSLRNPELFTFDDARVVKTNSVKYIYELATSRFLISNVQLKGSLNPRKKTTYIQTWHAAGAFKRFGLHIEQYDKTEQKDWLTDASHWEYLITSSKKIVDIYSSAFGISKEKVKPIGIPRNDILFKSEAHKEINSKVREKYRISPDKKIVLYTPTFRDYEKKFDIKLDLERVSEKLGEEYVLLLRLHFNVARNLNLKDNIKKNIIDASSYSDVQELLISADLLITDYSSIIFDYAILQRPMIFYSYDLKYYEEELRGFYNDYREFVPGPIVYTEEQLIEEIYNHSKVFETYREKIVDFGRAYNEYYDGNAAKRFLKLMFSGGE
jgi:CDP-glycerol glycerophosphotransferase